MIDVVTGFSDEPDTRRAIDEVLAQCAEAGARRSPSAALLFCGTEFDHPLMLERIADTYAGIPLIGCTTDGELSGRGGYSEDGVSLTLMFSDSLRIGAGLGLGAGADPAGAAARAVEQARAGLGIAPELAVVLPDGLTCQAFKVLDALNALLGSGVPVVGGMSADRVGGDKHDYVTYQFFGDRLVTDSLPVLLLGGPLAWSLGVAGGWSPIGRTMTVTRAEGNVVHEFDHRPALDLFTHYLGHVTTENLSGLGAYPLAVYEDDDDHYYLRVARCADPGSGSVEFLAEVPTGARVQLTQAVRDHVAEAAVRSIDQALEAYPGDRPSLALLFSCTGRKIALGTRTAEEAAASTRRLGPGVAVSGFYTFGEIAPVAGDRPARYHNTTFISLLLGERR